MNDQKFQAAYSHMLRSYSFGRHFWLDEDNRFCSCPTFTDGNPDLDHIDFVSDWTELDDVNLDQLFFIHAHLIKHHGNN
jgi:hypothetical protein